MLRATTVLSGEQGAEAAGHFRLDLKTSMYVEEILDEYR
jgi:hypothetical protein